MRRLWALVALVCCFAFTPIAQAQDAFTPAQREALRAMIRQYILENPEVLIEAIEGLETRRNAENQDRQRRALSERRQQIISDPAHPAIGNLNGNVTVVEFFDYRCPYCRRMHDPLVELLRSDPQVRFVHIQLPILGPDSVIASRAALAARAQNRYAQFHDALMRGNTTLNEATILRIAGQAGLDVNRLRADMASPQIEQQLQANLHLAEELGINGTPAFIIGETLVPGAVELSTLRQLVAQARGN